MYGSKDQINRIMSPNILLLKGIPNALYIWVSLLLSNLRKFRNTRGSKLTQVCRRSCPTDIEAVTTESSESSLPLLNFHQSHGDNHAFAHNETTYSTETRCSSDGEPTFTQTPIEGSNELEQNGHSDHIECNQSDIVCTSSAACSTDSEDTNGNGLPSNLQTTITCPLDGTVMIPCNDSFDCSISVEGAFKAGHVPDNCLPGNENNPSNEVKEREHHFLYGNQIETTNPQTCETNDDLIVTSAAEHEAGLTCTEPNLIILDEVLRSSSINTDPDSGYSKSQLSRSSSLSKSSIDIKDAVSIDGEDVLNDSMIITFPDYTNQARNQLPQGKNDLKVDTDDNQLQASTSAKVTDNDDIVHQHTDITSKSSIQIPNDVDSELGLLVIIRDSCENKKEACLQFNDRTQTDPSDISSSYDNVDGELVQTTEQLAIQFGNIEISIDGNVQEYVSPNCDILHTGESSNQARVEASLENDKDNSCLEVLPNNEPDSDTAIVPGVQLQAHVFNRDELKTKKFRFQTFGAKIWPLFSPNIEEIVYSGFFYRGPGDCTECFSCGIIVLGWQTDDIPVEEHLKHSPECSYIRNILRLDKKLLRPYFDAAIDSILNFNLYEIPTINEAVERLDRKGVYIPSAGDIIDELYLMDEEKFQKEQYSYNSNNFDGYPGATCPYLTEEIARAKKLRTTDSNTVVINQNHKYLDTDLINSTEPLLDNQHIDECDVNAIAETFPLTQEHSEPGQAPLREDFDQGDLNNAISEDNTGNLIKEPYTNYTPGEAGIEIQHIGSQFCEGLPEPLNDEGQDADDALFEEELATIGDESSSGNNNSASVSEHVIGDEEGIAQEGLLEPLNDEGQDEDHALFEEELAAIGDESSSGIVIGNEGGIAQDYIQEANDSNVANSSDDNSQFTCDYAQINEQVYKRSFSIDTESDSVYASSGASSYARSEDSEPLEQESLESLKETNHELRQWSACKVCLENKVSVLFMNCGHLACCNSCAGQLISCPVCRKQIQEIMHVYFQ